MLSFYRNFVNRYDLCDEGKHVLLEAGERLIVGHADALSSIVDAYRENGYQILPLEGMRRDLAAASGIPFETVNFVMLVCAAEMLLSDYRANGLSEKLFYDTMEDMIYKVRECKTVRGIYGIFVESWYGIFFRRTLFKLGRFEYEIKKFGADTPYEKHGVRLEPKDAILGIHIPSCGPLTREVRLESYRLAYDFFPEYRRGGVLPILCHSWLLYPGNREIFPASLNIVDFLSDFENLGSAVSEEYGDCWRLFGRDYDGHPERLPRDTSMQRAMADWLLSGRKSGTGFGLLLFDGHALLTRNDI